jgi:hypothetical protein
MRRSGLLILLAALATTACFPPRPFQPTIESDPASTTSLAQEEIRVLPIEPSKAFALITEALLTLNYRITTSDSANNVLSFEQTTTLKSSNAIGTATKQGTMHVVPNGSTVKVHLVLSGHYLYPGISGAQFTRLSATDHKQFFDNLIAAMKS